MDANISLFLQKLNTFIAYAQEHKGKITEQEIRDYFEGIDLNEDQLSKIYDYIQADEVQIERTIDASYPEDIDLSDLSVPEGTSEDDPVLLFINDLKEIPLISAEELAEMLIKLQAGDSMLSEAVMKSGQRLVYAIARKNTDRGVAIMDMVQEGNMGMILGLTEDAFAETKEPLLYLVERIRSAIEKVIAETSRIDKVPEHIADTMNKIRTVEDILKESGDDPSVADIAKEMNLPVERVQEIIRLSKED